ncbi:tail fiber domain-containing protein [uncultured Streptococcus sp.]|uniref:tail fiber domain-containing protein n=1 Tax=uncultured Streptococcus sp. TaxID=83427 RepID=UPI002070EC1E|nr:tail fiber domain-containing protein [uncultured Streptococcus sp.]DAO64156.1 MAG TPA: Neck appendage protein [Caudoviricetes sp.]
MDALTRRQFDRAMFAKNRTLAIRVEDYASQDIKEASFEYGYIKGDTYKPGGTCAGSGKITFTNIITTFNKLDILHPEIGLLVGDTYQWVKMGEYFINDIEIDRNRNTTTLELMDGMFKLNREYVTDLHFPAEVREVIQEICLKTGIELANDYFGISAMRYHVEQVPEGKKLSFRDMLSAMTQMIGMSCFFNREGKMEIRDLTESNITINADSYFLHGLTKSEIEYQIAGITCKTDKKPLTVGMKTGRSLELDNVFMTQSALNDLYYKLKNLTYYPYNLNYQGHLLLEVGQWVTIQTNKKETFKVPVLSQSFTFKGGLRGRISADSKAGNDTQYSYEGTITKQIKQQDGIEAKIQAQIEAADAAFDAEFKKRKKEIDDGIELAKAKAEEVKQELSDTINQRFNSFDNGPLKEAKRKAEEALKNAGASSSLAQEAKQIGLDSIARLEAFKSQTTTTQTALSGDLDALKRTITNDIRPKQAQAKVEIAKQVEALNKTKNELVGVKSAQATYEETTTRRLAELTNLANGKASKSELTQTAEELKSRIATVRVGGRNYIRGTRRMALANGLWTSGTFRPSGLGTTKTINVSDSPATGFDKAIRLTSSDARYQIGIAQDEFEIMPGTYTMSVWVKGSVGQRVRLQTYWAPDDATGISPYFILKDDKWTYLTFSSERKKAGTVSIGYVYLLGADAGEYLDVLAPQLENGSLATSPKEAPEDTDVQISAVESTFKQRADSLEAGVNRLTEGFRTKADISALNVTAENIRQSVKRLETDTQIKLNQKLSLAEFEVRAGSIRQEILNATKDKADKTLVVAEAGKLREEFSKMKVGSRNYAEDYDFSRGLWSYSQGDNSPQDWTISNGEYNVKGTTNTWKQMQIFSKEGSRVSEKDSTALLDLEIGETYTLSFQAMCHSGNPSVWVSLRANRTVPGNPEIMYGNFNLTSSWQTYQVTIPALTKPENFDFWRIILGYNEVGHVAFRKVELTRSSTRIDSGPAPEDGKTDLVVAKSEFQKTAEGLSMKIAAVESYVGQDSQRQEVLQRYTREESARQATAVREQISRDYVGKSAYQEDVRGLERRFSAISTQTSNDITSKIAQYKQTVDGRFASITSQIAGKANQTDFQRVRETSQLYERIIGSNENDISNKVARMALTNRLFQVEVSKNEGLKTVQRQLAGSWAVQNINSAGDIISGINLGANGHNRFVGKLTHITGETLIDNAVIKSAMVDKLKTANFEAGSVTTTILDAEAVTAEKLKVDNALIRKITANEAFIDQLTSKRIFATRIESVISSSTVLEGYKGWIGGFQLGTHDSGYGRWITGRNHFSVGMGNGEGGSGQTALWVNWGDNWNEPGYYAWFVKNNGKMYCYNTAEFWKTPIVHGDLKVEGNIIYDGGAWVYSNQYKKIGRSSTYYFYLEKPDGGRDYFLVSNDTSDRRLKSNIQESSVSGIDIINRLKTYSYRKEFNNEVEDISCGIMAQDVQKYAPDAFREAPDGVYTYNTFALVPYLIKAIQELNQKIEKMEKTIA